MRESLIERKVTAYAERQGWMSYKLNGAGDRGKPDRLYLKAGRAVFVEFKAPGRRTTALQDKQLSKLRELGFAAYVIDDVALGKAYIANDFGVKI